MTATPDPDGDALLAAIQELEAWAAEVIAHLGADHPLAQDPTVADLAQDPTALVLTWGHVRR
jgi:hypothetical protein